MNQLLEQRKELGEQFLNVAVRLWGKNLTTALNEIPIESAYTKKPKIPASVTSTLHLNRSRKSFKKQILKKEPVGPVFDGRNSLNKYIKSHVNVTKKPMNKPIVDMKTACVLARETSVVKLSRIELQVTRHCLQKKNNYMK